MDARNHAIFSCTLKGSNLQKERGLKPITKGAPAYGLVVLGNSAVVSTWFSTALYSVLIGSDSTVWQLEARDLGTRELYSLVSLNPSTQPNRKCHIDLILRLKSPLQKCLKFIDLPATCTSKTDNVFWQCRGCLLNLLLLFLV